MPERKPSSTASVPGSRPCGSTASRRDGRGRVLRRGPGNRCSQVPWRPPWSAGSGGAPMGGRVAGVETSAEIDGAARGAAGTALRKLRALVVKGELKPGDQIRQDEMAARLGVSRVPLREALRVLATEGLL